MNVRLNTIAATQPLKEAWNVAFWRLHLLLLVLFGAHLCVAGEPNSIQDLYARALLRFQDVAYFKPSNEQTGELAYTMAPLILQEVAPGFTARRFGRLVDAQVLKVDPEQPTVYFSSDTVSVEGKAYPRLAYLWCYPVECSTTPLPDKNIPPQAGTRFTASRTNPRIQGLRVTLTPSGQPVLWEPLGDTSGKHPIYVTATLETALTNRAAPPGRRFRVESSIAHVPDTLVPRILDDGPVPMGPIVYLGAATRDIYTVICRCMPAQATNIVSNTTYRLADINAVLSTLQKMRPPGAQWWPGEMAGDGPAKAILEATD